MKVTPLALMFLMGFAHAAVAEQPDETPVERAASSEDTPHAAKRIVEIVYDPSLTDGSGSTLVDQLMQLSERSDDLIQTHLGPEYTRYVRFRPVYAEALWQTDGHIRISVRLPMTRSAVIAKDGEWVNVDGLRISEAQADAYLDALLSEFEQLLVRPYTQRDRALNEYRRGLIDTRTRFEQEVRNTREEIEQLRDDAGLLPLSREAMSELIRELEADRRRAEMKKIALTARFEAVVDARDQQLKNARVETEHLLDGGDEIMASLMEIKDIREQELALARKLAEDGRAMSAEVTAAEADLVDIRVRIVERKQALVSQSGGEAADALTARLVEMNIDEAEADALLERYAELEQSYRTAALAAEEIEQLRQRQAYHLEQELQADRQLRAAQQQIKESPRLVFNVHDPSEPDDSSERD